MDVRWRRSEIEALAALPGAARLVADVAAAIASHAASSAPRWSGRYARSIRATGASIGPAGAEARVTTDDFKWHWVEYGTATIPAHRVMRTAAERAGARWADDGGGS